MAWGGEDTHVRLLPQDSTAVLHKLGRGFVRDSTLVLEVLQQQIAVRDPILFRARIVRRGIEHREGRRGRRDTYVSGRVE